MCPTELASAEGLAQQFCNLATPSTSLSFPFASHNATIMSSTPTTIPPTTTVASSTSSPTTKNAAIRFGVPWNFYNVLLFFTVVLGVM